MNDDNSARAELRRIVTGVNISRDSLDLLNRVEAADLAKVLSAIDGTFRDNKEVELVFANDGNPQDLQFRLVAVFFGKGSAGELYAQMLRDRNPDTSVRVMTFNKDKFEAYLQYASVNKMKRES